MYVDADHSRIDMPLLCVDVEHSPIEDIIGISTIGHAQEKAPIADLNTI